MTRTHHAAFAALLLLIAAWACAAPPLFLGVISDTQRPPDDALAELNWAVDQLNQVKPDAVLWTGDLTNVGAETEYRNVMGVAKRLTSPLLSLPGNHEAPPGEAVYRERFTRETGQPPWQHVRVGGWHLILLDSVRFADGKLAHGGHIGPEELAWLEHEVSGIPPDEPVILAAHHPFAVPGDGLTNGAQVLELLRDRALAFTIAGHFHGNRHDRDAAGVHHFITGALSFSSAPEGLGYRLFTAAGTDLWTAWVRTKDAVPFGPWSDVPAPGRLFYQRQIPFPTPASAGEELALRITCSGAEMLVLQGGRAVARTPASPQPATSLVILDTQDSFGVCAGSPQSITLHPLGEANVQGLAVARTSATWRHYRMPPPPSQRRGRPTL